MARVVVPSVHGDYSYYACASCGDAKDARLIHQFQFIKENLDEEKSATRDKDRTLVAHPAG